jgi:hypothetical protein
LKSVEALEPERLVMSDPIDERPESIRLDPVVDEATLVPFGYKASTAKRGQVLGDGGLGDVESRRQVLHRSLSKRKTFKNGASAWVRQSAEDSVIALHG